MIHVKKIHLREIALPLREPFEISSGSVQDRRILLVELVDASGAVGWGECVAGELPNYSPETIDLCWTAIPAYVAPRLLHRKYDGPEQVSVAFDEDSRGNNMAKAALEMAAWELAAQIQQAPLAALLGGTQKTIPVGISLGIKSSPEALAAAVREALDAGYRKVKIKIKPGKDVAYIRAARLAAGPSAPLMADANNAYSLSDAPTLQALDEFELLMIEQPLAWDDVLQHSALQAMLATPVCLDESITGLDRASDMIALRSGRIVNIKPGRVGGHSVSKAIHDLCAEHGVPVWCGGMLESGIGRAHNVALASLPNFTLPGDISPSSRYWAQDIIEPEWEMDTTGMVTVPFDKPGMGVEVDRDRVAALTVKEMSLE